MKLGKMTVSTICISPETSKWEEEDVSDGLNRVAGQRAVIMGDWNAKHELWDTTNNARGNRLKR